MKTERIKYVGKVHVMGDTVMKDYFQEVSGSAWKKAGTDILILHNAGFNNIIIRMNSNHPYRDELLGVAKAASSLIPTLKLEVTKELK